MIIGFVLSGQGGWERSFLFLWVLNKIKVPLSCVPFIEKSWYPFQILESFRSEYENQLTVFARVLKKKAARKASRYFFFSLKKLVRLVMLKEFKPSPDSKMIKLLTFDILFPPLPHSR